MQSKDVQFDLGFDVLLGDEYSQAAQMTIPPHESEGGPENSHWGADQWLFVVSGEGVAIIEGKDVQLRTGTLLLIQRGEKHEIKNTGNTPLKTLNFYAPPAFDSNGEALPAGKP